MKAEENWLVSVNYETQESGQATWFVILSREDFNIIVQDIYLHFTARAVLPRITTETRLMPDGKLSDEIKCRREAIYNRRGKVSTRAITSPAKS